MSSIGNKIGILALFRIACGIVPLPDALKIPTYSVFIIMLIKQHRRNTFAIAAIEIMGGLVRMAFKPQSWLGLSEWGCD